MNKRGQSSAGLIRTNLGQIEFRSDAYGNWKINVGDVVLIGEYTTQDGPMIEDHFLVMLTKDGNEYEVPMSVKGLDEVFEEIKRRMNVDVKPKLTLQTDFASHIIAPASLAGLSLYVFENMKQTFWQRLFRAGRVTRSLSSDAKSVLSGKAEGVWPII